MKTENLNITFESLRENTHSQNALRYGASSMNSLYLLPSGFALSLLLRILTVSGNPARQSSWTKSIQSKSQDQAWCIYNCLFFLADAKKKEKKIPHFNA